MFQRFRNIPPVCFLVSLLRIITGRLIYSSEYLNKSVQMEDGSEYTIFRQISRYAVNSSEQSCVFIVRFKFKHLSHKVNRIISIIPMLFIAGHPGLVSKCYLVNHSNGYWQGMYQWKSLQDLEAYKKSFVYRMMNKRALLETMKVRVLPNQKLNDYITNLLSDKK